MEMWRIYKEKGRNILGKREEFDWKGKIIYMAKIWKNHEFVWKREGIIKKIKEKWRISMEKWRICLEKWKNLYGPTIFQV
jgi:hypothetical protein